MLRTTLRGMRHRKLRLVLSGLAVVLGVMFVAGSLVLTDTLGRSFDQIFSDAYDQVDVLVQGEPNVQVGDLEGEQVPANLPLDTVETVAAVSGVASATGMVEADGARVIGADGSVVASFGPPRLGVNWSGEDELIQLREGRGPTADDEIAIDVGLAETAGLSVGDRVGVLTLAPRQDFTLVGTFGFAGGRDSLGGVQFVAFTTPVAQQLMLGEPDVWSSVEVQAADGVSPETLRDDLAAALGDGYQIRTGEQAAADDAAQLKEGLAFVNYILLGFAGVALFVGVFLILNTFSIIIAQRTRELALTRAIGASRRQVVGSVMLEAVVIGLAASVIGLAAGVGVGALLARLAASFAELPMAGLGVPPSALVAALLVGLLVTVVAAVVPALRASRVAPLAAMREAATDDRPLTKLSIAGTVVLVAGSALLGYGLSGSGGGTLPAILGGVVLAFIGVALLTPLIARPVVSLLGKAFAWSTPGELGRRNTGRNPRRTAITAAALMVGVALVSGVNVTLESIKTSFSRFMEESLSAELLISGEQTAPRPPTFDPAVLDQVAARSDVASVAGLYSDEAMVGDERTFVLAANDLGALAEIYGGQPVAGELTTLRPHQIAIDDTAADQRDLAVGDQLTVQLSRGDAHTLTVSAIYETNTLPGRYLLPQETTVDMGIPHPFLGFVQLSDGASVEAVEAALTSLLADSPEVAVTDQSGFLEQQTSQLDVILTMIQVLLGLAILIAVLGIINTLALSVIERTRELGLLRAVGLGRAASMRMVTVEAVVISMFGALLGIAVGTGLGAAVTRALRDEGITHLAIPWSSLATYLALAALVGVVAAVLPAIRAARTNVLRAIATE